MASNRRYSMMAHFAHAFFAPEILLSTWLILESA